MSKSNELISFAPSSSERLREPVLVTGATGFIGRHLVARLLSEGYAVKALVLPEDPIPAEWDERVRVCPGDVTDVVTVAKAIAEVGTVFHLAAVVRDWGDEAHHDRVTVGGTRNVLQWGSKLGARVVLASSIVVYGEQLHEASCTEDTPMGRPLGPYSRSKQAQERAAWEIAESEGLELTVVRPANVYGPGSGPWVHEVIDLLRGGGITLLDSGELNAGLCWIDNLIEILLRAGSSPEAIGRIYNAADGSDVTWKRYFTDLSRLAGVGKPRSVPLFLARPLATFFELLWKIFPQRRSRPPLTHEALNLVGSDLRIATDRAREELGYQPVVSYEQTLEVLAAYIELRC